MKILKPRQIKFVEHYIKTGNASASAKAAGYSEKNANNSGAQLLRNPNILAAVQESRKGSVSALAYTLEAAMKETDQAIEFARSTRNANAMVKAIEHKAKLNGLLIEKHEVKTAGFMISISGIDPIAQLPEANTQDLIPSPTIPNEEPTVTDSESETDE